MIMSGIIICKFHSFIQDIEKLTVFSEIYDQDIANLDYDEIDACMASADNWYTVWFCNHSMGFNSYYLGISLFRE